jgi:hypothetical protein
MQSKNKDCIKILKTIKIHYHGHWDVSSPNKFKFSSQQKWEEEEENIFVFIMNRV